jgi:hypothetical protein
MARRRRDRRLDPELALALARLRLAFGYVEVLHIRPNPPPPHGAPGLCRAGPTVEQAVLDLDKHGSRPPALPAIPPESQIHRARQGA